MSAALGRKLRDAGIQNVLALEGDWKESYRANLIFWFERLPRGTCFTGEALRFNARRLGTGEPAHFNAWGGASAGLIRTWLRGGMIEIVGLKAAESPATHAHLLREYRKI